MLAAACGFDCVAACGFDCADVVGSVAGSCETKHLKSYKAFPIGVRRKYLNSFYLELQHLLWIC